MADQDQERRKVLAIRFLVILAPVAAGVLLGMWVLLLAPARESACRSQCARNLSAIACACKMYTDYMHVNQGRYPWKWSDIYPNWVNDTRCLTCPSQGTRVLNESAVDSQADYVLVPGLTTANPPDWIVMYDRYPHSGDLVNVVRVGGIAAETISLGKLKEQLERQEKERKSR